MTIDEKTKISLAWFLGVLAAVIPAALGFSSFIDSHVDQRVTPIKELVIEMRQDIKDIKQYLIERKK